MKQERQKIVLYRTGATLDVLPEQFNLVRSNLVNVYFEEQHNQPQKNKCEDQR